MAAQEKGLFDDEIVPITVHGRKGDTVVSADEHPRPDTTLESLAKLRPVMFRSDADATVTAGNSSGQNDGASVCLVTYCIGAKTGSLLEEGKKKYRESFFTAKNVKYNAQIVMETLGNIGQLQHLNTLI